MKKLEEYELLVNDVFYRCHHILEYIKLKSPLTELDKEAIQATIMAALVDKELIDPDHDSLDFDNLCIRENNIEGYMYEKHPFVQGYPLWMKEKFRHKILRVTGSVPASLSLSMYAPGITRCIYDMNTTVSTLFDEFTFYEVDYNSPTRPGKRAENRPFLEVEIDGVKYLVDTATRRLFRSDEFKRRYGFDVKDAIKKSEFSSKQKELYAEMTEEINNLYSFGSYLGLALLSTAPFAGVPYQAEYEYEMEQARKIYPEAFEMEKEIRKEAEKFTLDHGLLKRLARTAHEGAKKLRDEL